MISIIICTYNRAQSLSKTLDSLARLNAPPQLKWELVLVDNNSVDDTAAVAKQFADTQPFTVKYVFEPAQGLSHARNAGISAAAGEVIAFSDDDVVFDEWWIATVHRTFEETHCVAAGGKVVPIWSTPKPSWFCDQPGFSFNGLIVKFDLGEERRAIRVSPFGANMAFRRSVFDKYGLFRVDLGRNGSSLMSGEESELFQRLIRAGELIIYAPDAIVYHPVPTERLTKEYARRLFLASGKMSMRIDGMRQGCIQYYGIPRYLIRMLGARIAMWMVAVNPNIRVIRSMQAYLVLGMIVECWTAGRRKQSLVERNRALNSTKSEY